jgi:hypothetical protein
MSTNDPDNGWLPYLLIFGGLSVVARLLFWKEPLGVCLAVALLGTVLAAIFSQGKG